jgi:outer membrane protein OmpA-like peptidoglycan-associated protein
MNVALMEDTKSKGKLISEGDIASIGSGLSLKTAPFSYPKNGTITLKPNGTYTYIPRADFVGIDSVIVKLCNSNKSFVRKCYNKTIIFTVNAVNDAPDANSDLYVTPLNTSIMLDVLSNDTSKDGKLDWKTLKVSSSPLHGTTQVDFNTGIITYVPNTGYKGEDNFSYEICDDGAPLPITCAIGKVVVRVGENLIAESPEKNKLKTSFYPEGFKVGADLVKLLQINNIYFDLDKSNIRPDASVELDKIASILKEYPKLKIQLISHTDCRMTEGYNIVLSNERAKNSKKYLVRSGVRSNQISCIGMGESQLVSNCPCEGDVESKCSEDEHQLNRRTECIIIKL